MTTKRAILYGRVSTDDQRGNYSIPTQIQTCVKYASAHGYTIVGDHFVDPETGQDCTAGDDKTRAYVDDYSSRELSRPALDAVMSFAEITGFDVLIVHALDRLARDPYIRQTLEHELNNFGVQVEYVLGNYDESPEGDVRKDLDATFAKWENTKRVERANRGKCGKAQRGRFVAGRTPYGYEPDADTPGGLRINDKQAEVVGSIFDLYVNQGFSIRGIASHLANNSIPTSLNMGTWGKSSIQRILANETYAGICYYNKHKRNRSQLIMRDRSEWIPIPVTPIIDRATWEAAQQKLADNKASKRSEPKRFYLLSGMIFCAKCGHAYIAQAALAGKSRRKSERLSYRHRIKEGHCQNHEISARDVEYRVWRDVVALINDPKRAVQGYTDAKKQIDAGLKRQRNHIANLEQSLDKLQKRRERLNRMYSDPDIGLEKEDYLKQKAEIVAEQTEVKHKITTANEELAKIPQPVDLATFEAFAAKIRSVIERKVEPLPDQKRRLLQMLHIKVYISPDDDPQVTGWFKPSDGLSSTASLYTGQQTIAFRLILSRGDELARVLFGTTTHVSLVTV